MEATICSTNSPALFCSIHLKGNASHNSCSSTVPRTLVGFKLGDGRRQIHGRKLPCLSGEAKERGYQGVVGSSVAELEGEGGEDWVVELGTNLRGKCKERRGVVELLECLETEAIMGEDEGRDPMDYNRRAQIFYTSSRVFQALKKSATPPHQST